MSSIRTEAKKILSGCKRFPIEIPITYSPPPANVEITFLIVEYPASAKLF